MRAWVAYAGASLVLVAGVAAGVSLATDAAADRAIWVSAGVAWSLQLAAFAALLAVRGQPTLFIAGWAGGMGLRGLALGLLAYAGTRTAAFPLEPLLVSFVAFLFLLVLLEPVFLKRGLRTS